MWRDAAVEGVVEGEAPLHEWWKTFDDPTLVDLIERAQAANLDLTQAVSRIREARAIRRIAGGDKVPDLRVGGEAGRQQLSDNLLPGLGPIDANSVYSLTFDSVWELDFWGRIRRQIESADASYQASIEDYRDVLVTLFAEVAREYFDLRALQLRIVYAEENIETQKNTLQLTRDRFDAGLVSALDIAQAESNLANTEAKVPTFEASLQASLNRLAVLLGEQPGDLHDDLAEKKPIPSPPDDVAVGLPADLLRQRPDVRRAERQLASQTARIGVAVADLYPRFSLGGFLGLQTQGGGSLVSGDSVTWGINLPFVWNLFAGGKLRGNIDLEKARTEQLVSFYEQTILIALEDVETALAFYEQEKERRVRLLRSVDATARSVDLVQTQYLAGLTDFQNVLDTERSLTARQDELAESEGLVVKSLASLYKALGGGWKEDLNVPETFTVGADAPTPVPPAIPDSKESGS
jgi:NodT family efflux transporter outer membrane factor (OMF) lipoprotein